MAVTTISNKRGETLTLSNGSELFIQSGLGTALPITKVNYSTGVITLKSAVGNALTKGTVIKLENGPGTLNGFWVIDNYASGTTLTIAPDKQKQDFKDAKPNDLTGNEQTFTGDTVTVRVVQFTSKVTTAQTITLPGVSRDTIDVTTTIDGSTQTVPGQTKFDDVSLDLFLSKRVPEQVALDNAFNNKDQIVFKHVLNGVDANYFIGSVAGFDGQEISAGGADVLKKTYKVSVNDGNIELELK